MTSRSKWIFPITLGVIALLATGYYFKDKFFKKKEVPAAKSSTKKPELQTSSQTPSALKSIDEINKLNQFNQQLQKEMQRQDRQLGK